MPSSVLRSAMQPHSRSGAEECLTISSTHLDLALYREIGSPTCNHECNTSPLAKYNAGHLETQYEHVRLSIRQGPDSVKVLGAAGVPHGKITRLPAHLSRCQELVKTSWLVAGWGSVADKPEEKKEMVKHDITCTSTENQTLRSNWFFHTSHHPQQQCLCRRVPFRC